MEDLRNIRVLVKNLSTSAVTYSSDTLHVRREWVREGQVLPIPASELQEVLYDHGTYNLFAMGYLGIDNPDHRKLVGLEYEDFGPQMVPFDRKRAERLLTETSIQDFKQQLSGMLGKTGQIDLLVATACNLKDVSYDKQQAIKEIFGIDITSLIKNNEA